MWKVIQKSWKDSIVQSKIIWENKQYIVEFFQDFLITFHMKPYTANVIPVKITDNPRTDPCTICVKCKYYRDYLYHDMPVIVI